MGEANLPKKKKTRDYEKKMNGGGKLRGDFKVREYMQAGLKKRQKYLF